MNYFQLTSKNGYPNTTEDLVEVVASDMDLNEQYKRIDNKLEEQEERQTNMSKEFYLSEKTLELIENRRHLL